MAKLTPQEQQLQDQQLAERQRVDNYMNVKLQQRAAEKKKQPIAQKETGYQMLLRILGGN